MSAQERNDAVVQTNTKQLEVPEYSRKQIANIVEPIVDEKLGDIEFPTGGTKIYKHEFYRKSDGKLLGYCFTWISEPITADLTATEIANAYLNLFKNSFNFCTDTGKRALRGYVSSNAFNFYTVTDQIANEQWSSTSLKEDIVTEL